MLCRPPPAVRRQGVALVPALLFHIDPEREVDLVESLADGIQVQPVRAEIAGSEVVPETRLPERAVDVPVSRTRAAVVPC